MSVGERLKKLRKVLRLSQEGLGEILDLGKSNVSLIENDKVQLTISGAVTIAKHLGVNLNWLLTGEGEEFNNTQPDTNKTPAVYPDEISEPTMKVVSEPEPSVYLPQKIDGKFQPSKVEIHAITVDSQGRENIHMVSTKAAAGYRTRFIEPEYIRKLPTLSIPELDTRNGSFRCFQVQGDSMSPGLQNGDYVIAQLVTNWATELSADTALVHVVVTKDDVLVKRVVNRLNERGKIVIYSDNESWPTDEVDGEDIREVWRAKAKISFKFPNIKFDTRKKLASIEADYFGLAERIKKLEKRLKE